MKHLTRFAAMMTVAAILAFLPGAQVCGQSRRGGGGSHSHSSGSSYSHSSGSHSGGPSSRPSGGHYSSGSSSRSSGSHYSGGSSSRPSGGSHISGSSSSARRPGGAPTSSGGRISSNSSSRPSGGSHISGSSSSARRPSGAPMNSGGRISSNSSSRPSGGSHIGGSSSSARRPGGAPMSNGGHIGSGSSSRPSGGSHMGDIHSNGARVPSGGTHIDGARRPGGEHRSEGHLTRPSTRSYADGSHSPRPSGGMRPAPGSRHDMPGHNGAPAHVRVNPHPGSHAYHRPEPRPLRGDPMRFHTIGHHHYGHYLTVLPRYEIRHYWGRDYYYYNDIWYRYYSGRYWVCRPPFGYVFTPLADAVYAACRFAYFFDDLYYYNTVNENARTIQAQNSTIAANNALIAQQNENIALNSRMAAASGSLAQTLGLVQSYAAAGTEYFYNDGVFYTKDASGQYTVIVPPAGALVDKLPDDFEIVELGGGTYYKVDDTIYRMTIDAQGNPCFEVLGQLVS